LSYLTNAEIKAIIGDVVASGLITESDLTILSSFVTDFINGYIGKTSSYSSGETGYGICRNIAIDLIRGAIISRRQFRETNLASAGDIGRWYVYLSRNHKDLLDGYRTKVQISHRTSFSGSGYDRLV